jgi:glycine reductase
VALVTEGGIVPKGNPDRLESSRASKFLKYSLEGIEDLSGAEFQSVHGGYSNVFANEDPDRVLPVDALRDCEREGKIGKLYQHFFTTTGNGTTLENGRKFGQEIARVLIADGVQAVILTST